MRHSLVRICACAAVLAASLHTVPVTPAHAGSGCVSDYSGDELNPIVSQTDFLATVDATRTYADITQACATSGATNTISITTTANIPTSASFPTVPQGDAGITYQGCADATGPIASGIVQIGIDHRGGPVFAGPYPANQGWKVCTWLSIQAATPNDYGMAIYDPDGDYTYFDFPTLTNMTAPVISGNTVTLSMPSTMCAIVNPPAPPLVGIARQHCYPFFNGSNMNNIVVSTLPPCACVNLPFPVCGNLNPPGISCNGNQVVGPIFCICIANPLPFFDWAPGSITCGTPGLITTCAPRGTPAGSPTPAGNGWDIGLVPGLYATPTCVNPLAPGPSVPPANNPLVTCGAETQTFSYDPCQAGSTATQDQGDLYTELSAAGRGSACTIHSASAVSEYDTEYGRITPAPKVFGFALERGYQADGWNE